ncbi:hypothetical protein A2U01_0024641, partial [Trifolium medium]|nr:hypothetical protein [Trifolium medium]
KFPAFDLENKVVFNGDGIVMKPINEDILKACESAKHREGPQNTHESNTVSNNADMIRPCKGVRSHKPNCTVKDFVKK